jgi:predicted transglutaminase-like cysteine proteinase
MNRFTSFASALIAALAIATAPAAAIDFSNVAFVQTASVATSIPVGHAEFCDSRPAECGPNTQLVGAVQLNETRWRELVDVNAHFNTTIIPVTDADLYQVEEFWTYPTSGYGDCEDYVLAKRRALIEAGWPASTLLISVVREPNGNGHAVLIVRTDRGDLVLDNQESMIRVWHETAYTFIKRQDQANAGRWVEMLDARVTVTASTGN